MLIVVLSFLLLLPTFILSCHPECVYQCSNPVCSAICETVCQRARCDICYNVSNTTQCTATNRCTVSCGENQCESDQCPYCTTQCSASICNGNTNCHIQCQAPECSWKCRKPTRIECPPPVCQIQCELPACQHQSSIKNNVSFIILFFIAMYHYI